MKIIQSFWTLPMLKREAAAPENRFSGGWCEMKYHLMSWAYSCLQLRCFYDEVELITDQAGKELLIDRLQLPYTHVKVVLDNLNGYDPNWWAIGKVYAFGLQDQPFLHVDGDVFIWEPFPERLVKAALVSQHLEYAYPFYKEVLGFLLNRGAYIPKDILSGAEGQTALHAFNGGIIGGNDLAFFKEYVLEAWKFIRQNQAISDAPNAGNLNAFYEQHLFYCMAARRKIPVECYTYETDEDRLWDLFKSVQRFGDAPAGGGYIHLYGEAKKMVRHCEILAERLRQEHQRYYYRVLNALTSDFNENQYDDEITNAAGDMAPGL
ncbi:MAG TPA: DUF6734 family protein [Puia sp.]|jgi:hypothetical protein|nr:DUF6734 family protein [Puia sp.]